MKKKTRVSTPSRKFRRTLTGPWIPRKIPT